VISRLGAKEKEQEEVGAHFLVVESGLRCPDFAIYAMRFTTMVPLKNTVSFTVPSTSVLVD